jgi:uncharacterized peroxidase-related enzyme
MARFPSLPAPPHLSDVLSRFGRGIWPLLEYHDVVLRGESEWSVGERELMAAYVSGVNACGFCHDSHRMIAELHGIEPDRFEMLLEDPSGVGLPPRLAAVLPYLRKLTLNPARLTDSDARIVFDADVSEQALFDAIAVGALFNFMNRIVEGTGVQTSPDNLAASRERHQDMCDHPAPYRAFAEMLGLAPAGDDKPGE